MKLKSALVLASVLAFAGSAFAQQSGMSGMSGMGGMSGQKGMSGMSGMSGQQGMSGMSGMSGQKGMSGMSGMAGAKAKPTKAERSAKSKECSAQADAKKLHGKERKKFRAACMKG